MKAGGVIMSAEIFSFIQSQVNTQPQTSTSVQQTNNLNSDNNAENAGSFFESFMASFSGVEELEAPSQQISAGTELEIAPQIMAFKSTNSFSGSVIDILAGNNSAENEEFLPEIVAGDLKNLFDAINNKNLNQTEVINVENLENLISQIIEDENFSEKLAALPENEQQEIKNLIDELTADLKNDGSDIKNSAAKLISVLSEHFNKAEFKSVKSDFNSEDIKNEDEDNEPETENSNSENNSGVTGLAGVFVININNPEKNSKTQPEIFDKENKSTNSQLLVRNTAHEISNLNTQTKTENEGANLKPEEKFSELLENRRAEHEENSQNNFSGENENNEENQDGNNFAQTREMFSSSRNSSRSRNDSRKISNENLNTQNERSSYTATNRTDSHNNFQAFFEGALTSRRTFSAAPNLPLNLRAAYNLNQSETLRDGLVNVVRFIRADGLHRANIVIDPPALGRISVELTSGTSGVEASIKVASEQIRNLVQDQLSQLRMNLSQQGVQVAEFTVDVQQDNSQRDKHNSQQDNQPSNRIAGITGEPDEEPEEFRVDLEEGLLYWVA